MKEEGEDEGP